MVCDICQIANLQLSCPVLSILLKIQFTYFLFKHELSKMFLFIDNTSLLFSCIKYLRISVLNLYKWNKVETKFLHFLPELLDFLLLL